MKQNVSIKRINKNKHDFFSLPQKLNLQGKNKNLKKMKTFFRHIITIVAVMLIGHAAFAQQIDFKIHNQNLDRHEVVIYPNPVASGEMVKIKSSFTIKDIEITNIIGKCVQREKNAKQIYDDITLKLDKNAPGVYYAKITFEDDKWIIKKLLVR